MIHFGNVATFWPRPPGVAKATVHCLEHVGVNPGR